MITLGLDTTGPDCSACLVKDDQVLAYSSERLGRGHAERLAPMVVELMATADVNAAHIDRIAVCSGPGSFTGLRVGLSFAKGFALPRRTPIVGIDAVSVEAKRLFSVENKRTVTVFRDVKRGQVFAASFKGGMALAPPQAMSLDDATALAHHSENQLFEAAGCDVRILARMAASVDPTDYPADPLYARAPDAKLPGGHSLPAA